MANYDHRADYGVSSPSSSPLKETSTSVHDITDIGEGGGLVDSGFDTLDLLLTSPTSTNSSYMNGHHRLSPEPFDPLKPVQEAGDPPTLLELDFFDPLAPLPEEFPSPQEASSPNDDLMYPEDIGGSPTELEVVAPAASPMLDFFTTVVDSDNFQPSPPSPHSEEGNSFSEPLHFPPTVVQTRERDSGAECDSLDDDGPANANLSVHPSLNNNTYQLPTHEDAEDYDVDDGDDVVEEHDVDENPHSISPTRDSCSPDEETDHAPNREILSLSPLADLKSAYLNKTPERVQNKEFIETGVSIDALKSTYLMNGHVEELDEKTDGKEVISTGVDIKSLKENYYHNAQTDEDSKYKEKIETGVSIQALKTSFTSSEMNGDSSPGIKIDRARITRSFSQVMSRDEQSHLCRICGRPVFLMDRIKAEKSVFHKTCFRCKECNKQLMVDSYSSHEGVLYCKLHFKQLFQPKAKFDDEGPHMPRRRNESIIKENVPMELPPDVVRSSDKPDYGLEELPSLQNIKSRFESGEQDGEADCNVSQINVKRSESILNKMAKFQSGNNENGHYEDYSSDEDEQHDPDVIRETRKKEKLNASQPEKPDNVSFSGMNDLRTQWEKGGGNPKEEEWTRETQEELTKLRQRICQGKGNVKAVYENAIQEMERSPMKETFVESELREIRSIAEKWERGDVLNEAEREKLDHFNQEREQDLSVFKESGTSAEARNLFKRIDEVVVKSGSPISLNKSPVTERSIRPTREILYSAPQVGETEIVRSSNQKEDIVVDSTGLHEKFKFFENFQDVNQVQQDRKRFTMMTPRDLQAPESDDEEIPHDPNVVRSCDPADDIAVIPDTAKKMLNKFREMEIQAERGGSDDTPRMKPLKRITPPRDYTTYSDEHDNSPEPERDPNIIRSSDKIEDVVLIEAEKTRNLRAKFENWTNDDDEDDENIANGDEEEEEEEDNTQPSIDTTKNLKAKFEALREETERANQKPKLNKVNRFL